MFSFFKKDPIKKLNQQYFKKLEQAMQAQRNGDIRSYSMISSEAELLLDEIKQLEKSSSTVSS